MEENFNNLENAELNKDGKIELINKEEENKLNVKMYKIIMITFFLVISIILIIFISSLLSITNDNKINNNENENFQCQEGDEDKCLKCKNNICIKCNPHYELLSNGKCKATFSYRATYETNNKNEEIELINIKFKDNILKLIIDEK